tara:strand:- start:423 stop:530 length:108 start_codon:yes stop_codon:yes gene_type:complete
MEEILIALYTIIMTGLFSMGAVATIVWLVRSFKND